MCRSGQAENAARTPFTECEVLLEMLERRLHCCELQPFFRITARSASLSQRNNSAKSSRIETLMP